MSWLFILFCIGLISWAIFPKDNPVTNIIFSFLFGYVIGGPFLILLVSYLIS